MDREDDCYGRNEQAEAYIYRNLHALWLLTSFSKNWVPTEVDKTALADMLNRCGEVGLSHHGAKRHWSALLDWDTVTEKNLERVMHSADEQTAFYGYHVFAIAMENPEKSLLSEEELQTGMEVTAQQIAWGGTQTACIGIASGILCGRTAARPADRAVYRAGFDRPCATAG